MLGGGVNSGPRPCSCADLAPPCSRGVLIPCLHPPAVTSEPEGVLIPGGAKAASPFGDRTQPWRPPVCPATTQSVDTVPSTRRVRWVTVLSLGGPGMSRYHAVRRHGPFKQTCEMGVRMGLVLYQDRTQPWWSRTVLRLGGPRYVPLPRSPMTRSFNQTCEMGCGNGPSTVSTPYSALAAPGMSRHHAVRRHGPFNQTCEMGVRMGLVLYQDRTQPWWSRYVPLPRGPSTRSLQTDVTVLSLGGPGKSRHHAVRRHGPFKQTCEMGVRMGLVLYQDRTQTWRSPSFPATTQFVYTVPSNRKPVYTEKGWELGFGHIELSKLRGVNKSDHVFGPHLTRTDYQARVPDSSTGKGGPSADFRSNCNLSNAVRKLQAEFNFPQIYAHVLEVEPYTDRLEGEISYVHCRLYKEQHLGAYNQTDSCLDTKLICSVIDAPDLFELLDFRASSSSSPPAVCKAALHHTVHVPQRFSTSSTPGKQPPQTSGLL
ncbi:hypothetical protein J6590_024749 [Homalodisca vitripennis]|nr:hypothetical protein J6590_024749 [Homalodisca vitripennis]